MRRHLMILGIMLFISSTALAVPECGLFKEDSGKIIVLEASRTFVYDEVEAKGGFAGREIIFGCWVEIGKSIARKNTKMYSYRVKNPLGEVSEFGPYGIQIGGFGTAPVQMAGSRSYTGSWSVEFFLIDRSSLSKKTLGIAQFRMTGRSENADETLMGGDIIKCGIFRSEDGRVSAASVASTFSLAELDKARMFSGRGELSFGCWSKIGTDEAVRNSQMYGYQVTSPGGEKYKAGPYGIPSGGWGSGAITVPNFKEQLGKWLVEYFLISRETGKTTPIGDVYFVINK